jgi:hypothetical protein
VYSHDIDIKVPEPGCDVTTLEVKFTGEDGARQLIEKVLVRLDDMET